MAVLNNSTQKPPNFNWILIGILLFLLIWQLAGCASPQKLVDKAMKRGYVLPEKEILVPVEVILKGIDGKDSVVERLVSVKCPDIIPPKTWFAEWQESKRYADSLKFATRNNRIDSRQSRSETKSNNKAATKQTKSANKTAVKIQNKVTKQAKIAKGSTFWQRFKNATLWISLLLNIVLLLLIYLKQLKKRFLI